MNIIIILFITILLWINYYLFQSTNQKIKIYNQTPPFIWLDYTNSEWKNSASKLKHLFDQNPNTFWRKERESKKEWDLDLELKLTHIFKNGVYVPRNFEKIQIRFCEKPSSWKWEVFLHEAINVDKELRLPHSTYLLGSDYEILEKEKTIPLNLNLPISKILDPNFVFIIGIRLKAKELGACISEIQLQEK